jgi:hypothetical protein
MRHREELINKPEIIYIYVTQGCRGETHARDCDHDHGTTDMRYGQNTEMIGSLRSHTDRKPMVRMTRMSFRVWDLHAIVHRKYQNGVHRVVRPIGMSHGEIDEGKHPH